MALTIGQIKEATCSTTAFATKFSTILQSVMDTYSITTPNRQLCFLAQVGHESGGLFYTEEIASGTA
jgi:putative chitinase